MESLFYSQSEQRAFLIPDHYIDSNSNVNQFTANLHKHASELVKACNGTPEMLNDVKSSHIESSRRYKYMRVFWIDNIGTCPKGAFELGIENGWTMWKMVTD